VLPIARDNHASLCAAFELAQGADLIVTVGGASVGDHDLVGRVAADLGMQQSFYKVAMRPGKPLMAGMLGNTPLIGLPGNPVSSMVCGTVFLQPAIAAMLGLPKAPAARQRAILAQDLAQNGTREHYMRAVIDGDQISACARQDSALLSVLSRANALIVRPVGDSARKKGSPVDHIPL
jgi:molybdopterin molybdotransferase